MIKKKDMEDITKTQIKSLEMKNLLYAIRRLDTAEEKINTAEDSKRNSPKWSRERIDKWAEYNELEDNLSDLIYV